MRNNMTLYEVKAEYLAALENAETDEQLVGWMKEAFTNKAIAVAGYFRNHELLIDQIRKAEREMAARRKTIAERVKWLKNYLKRNMEDAGIQKIECPEFRISIRKNPPRVHVHKAEDLPYDMIEVTVKMTKEQYEMLKHLMVEKDISNSRNKLSEIKANLENGGQVPGAELVQDTHVEID